MARASYPRPRLPTLCHLTPVWRPAHRFLMEANCHRARNVGAVVKDTHRCSAGPINHNDLTGLPGEMKVTRGTEGEEETEKFDDNRVAEKVLFKDVFL